MADRDHSPEAARLTDPERLTALRSTGLLDTPPEQAFDRFTELASALLEVPLALVNLIDSDRQFSKSCFGPAEWSENREAPLTESYCRWTVVEEAPVVINDARDDPRVRGTPPVDRGAIAYLGVPLRLPDGQILGSLCAVDFEPRVWRRRDVHLLSNLAEATIGEIELRMAVAERRAIERLKDEIISVVAHELRTPLTAIRASLNLLGGGMVDPASPKGVRMLEMAARNTDRLVELINRTLDLERIESGAADFVRRAVDPAQLLTTAVETLRTSAEQAELRLECHAPSGARVYCDPDRIVQVLVNLLGNAIRYSPRGSRIILRCEPKEDEMRFSVLDEGRGIPAERLEVIFDRFRQVDRDDARDRIGSGLGLAISRAIVVQHGGRIGVESEPGLGSTFHFTIPAALY